MWQISFSIIFHNINHKYDLPYMGGGGHIYFVNGTSLFLANDQTILPTMWLVLNWHLPLLKDALSIDLHNSYTVCCLSLLMKIPTKLEYEWIQMHAKSHIVWKKNTVCPIYIHHDLKIEPWSINT